MLTTSELKDRIRNLIAECEIYSTTWDIGDRLRALLADIDAEPPKPTGEKVEHYSCIGCGCFPAYPGPVCESCFDRTTNPILRRNYTPKEPKPVVKENFTAVEPEPGLVSATLPKCFFCGKEQTELGGLLFGPPNKDGCSRKIHACVACWFDLHTSHQHTGME